MLDPLPPANYGYPEIVPVNPETHTEHRWLWWRLRPGSSVTGLICLRCGARMVD